MKWDAWRREDGRWSLVGRFETPERSGTAEFTYDGPGNYVVLDNDEARWLVGEVVAGLAPQVDDLEQRAVAPAAPPYPRRSGRSATTRSSW